MGSILMGIAKSNGWIDYEEKVVKYWPEFGGTKCGKENLKVKDILRQESFLDRLVVDGHSG